MRNIADTIRRLNVKNIVNNFGDIRTNSRLDILPDFGSNSGRLRAWKYIPAALPANSPLVVILHGCTQTAAEYDLGSGWSALADRFGFALLFPEQQRVNNPNLCFNWFSPSQTTRGHGEVLSIRQMIENVIAEHSLDSQRTFITGLSAGGAMTSAMLATYPETFKAGAIIAGLPYGTASTIPEAFDRMRGHGLEDSKTLADRVRQASDHKGPWPLLSIWHGNADKTVLPVNMEAIVAQWHSVHAIGERPVVRIVDGHTLRQWRDSNGTIVIDAYTIAGMGHGTPISVSGPNSCGRAQPFMLDANISSTWHIAMTWGLLDVERKPAVGLEPRQLKEPNCQIPPTKSRSAEAIEYALRAAGLMK
ncbi:extracellular catalytic domain type 1 short-chain-length polyhydroxyalkanoate depolymerase [Phyllobacterium endophyticum]|uniref:extracellular catalytic domain type 1 short-chain-length polyhydroxyalkanoate depolymerase n=1 Tax=Phyllobacterium endophyticum TaxID=1149773 RepID=UPI0011C8A1CA|nr:PHB depolymerase family esterase [Phyllobacterium endophyticum]TXR49635.1 PHB depolymerase family esterase [Phyllobacterium endophyticum]